MLDLIGRYFPPNASAHGAQLDHWTNLIHWLMLVLFVGWGAYFVFVLFRFRSGRSPQADPVGVRSHFATYTEVGVAVVEAITSRNNCPTLVCAVFVLSVGACFSGAAQSQHQGRATETQL